MTEKRFTEIISTQKIVDNVTGREYDGLVEDDLLHLMNELADVEKILRKYEISSLEKLDQILFEQRVW